MSAYASTQRGFYRNGDRAMLGGVCAGLADYFGFNLCVTRFLVIVAFIMATPVTVLAYIAAVLLVPSRSLKRNQPADPELRRAVRSSPAQAASDLRRRLGICSQRNKKTVEKRQQLKGMIE